VPALYPGRARAAMTVGVNPAPAEYRRWFPRLAAAPADTRVHFGPGEPLRAACPAIVDLPAGTLPWCSHADEIPVADISAFWSELIGRCDPGPDRRLKWTFRPCGESYDRIRYLTYWRDLRRAYDDHPLQDRIELINIHTLHPRYSSADINWRHWMLPGITHIDGWACIMPPHKVYRPAVSFFALPVAASREFAVPFCIAECAAGLCPGDVTGAGRAAWLRESLTFLERRGCRSVGLTCTAESIGGRRADYRPHDAATLEEWRAALDYYQPIPTGAHHHG
jgi:hypothetical protein